MSQKGLIMKNFFTATDLDTISECLNGEKLLSVSRNAQGFTELAFESRYEDHADLLTVKPGGALVGVFVCDEDAAPQTVNDNPCVTDLSILAEDKKLCLLCSVNGLEDEDPSAGIELHFSECGKHKEPDSALTITPALVDGKPILKVEITRFPQQ